VLANGGVGWELGATFGEKTHEKSEDMTKPNNQIVLNVVSCSEVAGL